MNTTTTGSTHTEKQKSKSNDAGSTEVLLLYNYLDEYEARDVARRLQHLPAGTGTLQVRIHSPGGEAFSGLALYQLLKDLAGKGIAVHTYIDGLAASMAGIVAMAAHKVYIARNARLMIHNPWAALQGDGDALRAGAEELDKLRRQLAAIYAAKCNVPEEQILALMDAETYLTAEEALALGLADEILDNVLHTTDAPARAMQASQKPMLVHGAYNAEHAAQQLATSKTETTNAATNLAELNRLRTQLQQAENELAQLKEDLKLTTAERLVDVALAEGRIVPAQREALVLLALHDAAQVQTVLQQMGQPLQIRGERAPGKSLFGQLKSGTDGRADWNLRDWEKRDPAGLQHLRTHEPARYQRLFEQTYGRERVDAHPSNIGAR